MAFVKREIVGSIVKITLGNGQDIQIDYDDLSEEMQRQAGLHGLKQKLGDGSSSFSKAKDYLGAYTEICAIRDSVLDGTWNRKGTGTGTRDIVEALSRVTKQSLEDAQAVIDGMDEDTFAALKKHKGIISAIKDIQAERAAQAAETAEETLDLDALF